MIKMWGSEDTIGIISLILGKIWFIIARFLSDLYFALTGPNSGRIYILPIIMVAGGILCLIMGIIAIVCDSKLGFGGIITGTLWIIIGLIWYVDSITGPKIHMI